MALSDNQLFASVAGRGSEIRMEVKTNKVGTLAAVSGAPVLPKGCPLAFATSTGFWLPWTQPSDAAVYTLTRDAGAGDGGTFLLVIDGEAVVMDWDEDTAGVLANINAVLDGAGAGYNVTVANSGSGTDLGTSANVQTITFAEAAGAPDVVFDGDGLTDGGVIEPTGIALAATDAGTALSSSNKIRGFLQDADPGVSVIAGVQSDASDEIQIVVMLTGSVHRDDINTAAMLLALSGSPSEAELDIALQDQDLLDKGLVVRGLSGIG